MNKRPSETTIEARRAYRAALAYQFMRRCDGKPFDSGLKALLVPVRVKV